MIKLKIHSIVDVITNSSTVIFTYQDNSVDPAKDLVNEMLKLSGEEEKTADDIFYFGVFVDNDKYFEHLEYNKEEGFPTLLDVSYNDPEYKIISDEIWEKIDDLKLSILKGETEKPEWMTDAESTNGDWWAPDSYLELIPKDKKYEAFGDKISALLNSISADGGRDG